MNAEQVARNDALYRDANERIERAAEAHDFGEQIPFICECADPSCTDIVPLTLNEYEEIRASPVHFFNVPGHEVRNQAHLQVVLRRPGYVIVEKIGRAGEIARAHDRRGTAHG